jgi:hypothetical protein
LDLLMFDVSAPRLVVSSEALSADDESVIRSFVSVVRVLLDEGAGAAHLADGALAAFQTDFYLTQVGNGGFAQFLWNGGRDPEVMPLVRDGLSRFGGEAHRAVFERSVAGWDALSPAAQAEFTQRGLFGSNPLRDQLSKTDDEYFALHFTDPLADRLAAWLRAHPDLQAVPRADLERYVAARMAVISA